MYQNYGGLRAQILQLDGAGGGGMGGGMRGAHHPDVDVSITTSIILPFEGRLSGETRGRQLFIA